MADQAELFDPEESKRPRNPDGTFAKADAPPAAEPVSEEPTTPEERQPSDSAEAPPGPAEPKTYRHSNLLREAAEEFGFSQDEIDSTPTDILAIQCFRIQKNLARRAPGVAAPEKPVVEEEPDLGIGADQLGHIDEDIVKAMKHLAKKNRDLETRLAETHKHAQAQQKRSIETAIDDAFASLPAQYTKIFGEGAYEDLQKSNPSALKRRVNLLNAAGINASNLPSPKVLAKKLQAEADDFFMLPKEQKEGYVAEQKKNGKYTDEEWKGGSLARPTHKQIDDLPPGEEKARRAVAARLGADLEPSARLDDMGFLPAK